ncbi:MAG: hypothetical protein COV76_04595, partial [Candidatus Omnitrophica bacterium CG11_big_fil_rev_8_21_14_0_20_64_10]
MDRSVVGGCLRPPQGDRRKMTEIVNGISTIFGASWAAGVRLYMTIAALGLAQRFGWMDLPGNLDRLGHPLVILIAGVLTV